MSKQLKKVFTAKVKNLDDMGDEVEKEVELAVRVPTALEKQQARRVYAKEWKDSVQAGAIMRQALDKYLKEQNLWDDVKEKEYQRLNKLILDSTFKIQQGGNAGLTKKKAKELALQIIDWKNQRNELLMERNRVDANTADALADQAQFNYYVAACTVYNDTNNPFFRDVDDYVDRQNEDVAVEAATKLAEILYGSDEDNVEKLPEKKFLKDIGCMDEKGRLIDDKGRLVDRDGRLINDKGRFINEAGEYVDRDGKRVDDKGEYVVEFAPFLDDEEDKAKKPAEKPKDNPPSPASDSKTNKQELMTVEV